MTLNWSSKERSWFNTWYIINSWSIEPQVFSLTIAWIFLGWYFRFAYMSYFCVHKITHQVCYFSLIWFFNCLSYCIREIYYISFVRIATLNNIWQKPFESSNSIDLIFSILQICYNRCRTVYFRSIWFWFQKDNVKLQKSQPVRIDNQSKNLFLTPNN